jgi:hypothetical protein
MRFYTNNKKVENGMLTYIRLSTVNLTAGFLCSFDLRSSGLAMYVCDSTYGNLAVHLVTTTGTQCKLDFTVFGY